MMDQQTVKLMCLLYVTKQKKTKNQRKKMAGIRKSEKIPESKKQYSMVQSI